MAQLGVSAVRHRCPPAAPAGVTRRRVRTGATGNAPPDDDVAFQPQRGRIKAKVKVVTPFSEVETPEAKARSLATTRAETVFVVLLASAYVLILGEGLVLAASASVPAGVSEAVYGAFTPTVFSAVALSAAYGVWKSRQ